MSICKNLEIHRSWKFQATGLTYRVIAAEGASRSAFFAWCPAEFKTLTKHQTNDLAYFTWFLVSLRILLLRPQDAGDELDPLADDAAGFLEAV